MNAKLENCREKYEMTTSDNPKSSLKGKGEDKQRRFRRPSRVLSVLEVKTLLKAPEDNRERVFLNLLTYTGFRIIDIVGMKIESINFTNKAISLIQKKTEKIAFMPVSDRLLSDIKVYLNETLKGKKKGYLFPSPKRIRRHLTTRTGENILNTIVKRVGLKDITPHDFRSTLMTRSGKVHIDTGLMSGALGTSSDTMDSYYKKYTPEEVRSEISKIWEVYDD